MMLNKALLFSLAGHVLVICLAGAVVTPEGNCQQGPRIVLAAEILQEQKIPSVEKASPPRPRSGIRPTAVAARPQSRSIAPVSSSEQLLTSAASDAVPLAGREERAVVRGGGDQRSAGLSPPQRIGESAAGGGNQKQSYYVAVTARLERARGYPKEARRRGYEGTVLLKIELERDGSLLTCAVLRGSGRDILDKEALQTVRRAAPFPQVPESITGELQTLTVPLCYTLK